MSHRTLTQIKSQPVFADEDRSIDGWHLTARQSRSIRGQYMQQDQDTGTLAIWRFESKQRCRCDGKDMGREFVAALVG